MVAINFYGVIIMLYGEVVDPIFHITLTIFVKFSQRNLFDRI